VSGEETDKKSDKPLVETDSYRIWGGNHIPPEEQEKMKQITLSVCPGERVHNIVVIDLGGGYVLKVLSKVRDKDGRINVLLKLEKPMNRCSVMRSDEWVTKDRYDELLGVLKKELPVSNISVTSGEEVHVGIGYMLHAKKKKTRRKRRWEHNNPRGSGAKGNRAGKGKEL